MTHFLARFPQNDKPIQDPIPDDYLLAESWYRRQAWRAGKRLGHRHQEVYILKTQAERFMNTYRMALWAQRIARRRTETMESTG